MFLKKGCSFSSSVSRVAPSRCFGLRLRSCTQPPQISTAKVPNADERTATYPLDKLFTIFTNNSSREFDLSETTIQATTLRQFSPFPSQRERERELTSICTSVEYPQHRTGSIRNTSRTIIHPMTRNRQSSSNHCRPVRLQERGIP